MAIAAADAPEINDPAQATKSAVEVALIGRVLRGLDASRPGSLVVDRLGGRKFYAGVLAGWFGMLPEAIEEAPLRSRYRVGALDVEFAVGADAASPCVGAASCVAKFVRECWMGAFNAWWSRRLPGLRATAGYPEDAARWLRETQALRSPGEDALLIRRR